MPALHLLPLFLSLNSDLANARDLGGRWLRVIEAGASLLVAGGGEHGGGLPALHAAVGSESPAEGGGEGGGVVT